MKVGDYVRISTMSGQSRIAKLEKIDDICITDKGAVDKNNIIKSSPNIIDLIEVGDYVNGNLVTYIGSDCIEVYWYKDEMQWLEQEDIISIVTHEQFSQMEYKVGE